MMHYNIREIRQIAFLANETLVKDSEAHINSSFNAKVSYNKQDELLNIAIRMFLHHVDDRTIELASTIVENVFFVQNLADFVGEDKLIKLPPQMMISLVATSISHTRALFMHSLAPTIFSLVAPSLVDPTKTTRMLFPYVFDNETKELVQPGTTVYGSETVTESVETKKAIDEALMKYSEHFIQSTQEALTGWEELINLANSVTLSAFPKKEQKPERDAFIREHYPKNADFMIQFLDTYFEDKTSRKHQEQ